MLILLEKIFKKYDILFIKELYDIELYLHEYYLEYKLNAQSFNNRINIKLYIKNGNHEAKFEINDPIINNNNSIIIFFTFTNDFKIQTIEKFIFDNPEFNNISFYNGILYKKKFLDKNITNFYIYNNTKELLNYGMKNYKKSICNYVSYNNIKKAYNKYYNNKHIKIITIIYMLINEDKYYNHIYLLKYSKSNNKNIYKFKVSTNHNFNNLNTKFFNHFFNKFDLQYYNFDLKAQYLLMIY
jgi:hypothetical protein